MAQSQGEEEESAQKGAPGPPPAKVKLEPIRRQSLRDHWDVTGRLQPVQRAMVAAEQSGRIVAVAVEEGDPVWATRSLADEADTERHSADTKNAQQENDARSEAVNEAATANRPDRRTPTLLARIDDVWPRLEKRLIQAQLEEARTRIPEAQAMLEMASRERRRLEKLEANNAARTNEVDDSRDTERVRRAQLESAKANVQIVQARMARIEERLNRVTITAPFDGVVIRKLVEVGQWVDEGEAVVEIVSRGQIDAVIDVPENLIQYVAVGDRLRVTIDPLKESLWGGVVSIIPDASTAARTFPVKIRLDDRDGRLKAGMSVTAEVPTGEEKPFLLVPRNSLMRNELPNYVWANMDGAAMRVPVRELFGYEDMLAVQPLDNPQRSMLQPGGTVVTEGRERIMFPGQPLMPMGQQQASPEDAAPTQ